MSLHLQLIDYVVEAVVEEQVEDLLEAHLMHRLVVVDVLHELGNQQVVKIDLAEHGLYPVELEAMRLLQHVGQSPRHLAQVSQPLHELLLLADLVDEVGELVGDQAVDQSLHSFFVKFELVVELDILVGDYQLDLLQYAGESLFLTHVLAHDTHGREGDVVVRLGDKRIEE